MRIPRHLLSELNATGASAALAWSDGDRERATAALRTATQEPALFSPGTGFISPQAASLLGRAVAGGLRASEHPEDQALTLAGHMLASPAIGLRMLGPHILTPFAQADPAWAARTLGLATICYDAAAADALVIPLVAAGLADANTLGRAIKRREQAEPRLLENLWLGLSARSPQAARNLRRALAGGPSAPERGKSTPGN